ncbi:MAG: hypothetical protein QOE77_1906 [Blastocatellia bacterium]|jgi:hypothetical protein|nr:hypothetical protein [Blastocatellia bacterium]
MKTPGNILSVGALLACLAVAGLGQAKITATDSPADQEPARLSALLDRVRNRIHEYHEALFNLTVIETVTQQQLHDDATPKGKPRSMMFESVILHRQSAGRQKENDTAPIITRTLQSINGRPAKPEAPKRRSKCVDTDPAPAYGDPLSFLLAETVSESTLAYLGEEDLDGSRTAVVSITTPRAADPVTLVEKDNCFRLSRGLQRKATVWIDLKTFDVLQLRWELVETFNGKLPAGVAKVGILPVFRPRRDVAFERSDFLIRFRPVTFPNPMQTLLLPATSESTWIIKGGGIAGFKTNTEYSRYRRFRSRLEVKDPDGSDLP